MDKDAALDEIRQYIKDGKDELAGPRILELASASEKDPMTLLTCASMLRTIGRDTEFPGVLDVIMSNLPEDASQRFQVAQGLIGLGCLKDADRILAGLDDSDRVRRARAAVMHGLSRDEEALAQIDAMGTQDETVVVLRTQVLGSLGRHEEAVAEAEGLIKVSTSYAAGRAYVSALCLAGRDKDAGKYARERLKEKTADGYAIMAYFQWVKGNSTASGAYSSKALQLDEHHLGALETIGYSFADKKSYWEAKVAAGAINEIEPGNPAVFRILSMCRE